MVHVVMGCSLFHNFSTVVLGLQENFYGVLVQGGTLVGVDLISDDKIKS